MAGAVTALRLGIALLIAGVLLASPVLLLPGVALLLTLGGCSAWVRLSAIGVQVRCSGMPAQVTEGERFDVVLDGVSGWLPLICRVEDEVLDETVTLRALRPRGAFSVSLDGSIGRRGRHMLPMPTLRLGDPFGIAENRIVMGRPGSILVLPRVEPLAGPAGSTGPAIGRRSMGLGELVGGGERESAADPELDGVRPYRPGTRATRIYWPSLARGAELTERHLVAADDAAPLIVLDPSGAVAEEDLDRAVRAAASLMAHLARLGGCELLIAGTRQRLIVGRDPRAWRGALAALAVVEGSDGVPRLANGDLRSAVIWVGASSSPRLPAQVTRGFVVAPAPLAGRPVSFTVAGCSGHAIAGAELGRIAA
jgi:uncharacterized protein (DUF58 family)